MRYRVTIGGRERVVDVTLTPSGAHVTVDDEAVNAEIDHVPGGVLLKIDGKVYDIATGGSPDATHVVAGARSAVVSVENPRNAKRSKRRGAASNEKEIRSPMPGKVLKVLVEAGASVAAGDAVVIIEAMKMENELRAPADGEVSVVHVVDGQDVDGGALLVSFL